MATSGTYTETRTAAQLILDAMLTCGAIEIDGTPTAAQYAYIIRCLNDIIFQWSGPESVFAPGLKMWQRESATLTLTAAISFSLKPSGGDLDIQIPMELLSVVLRNTDSDDTVLSEMTFDEYHALSNKTETGTPTRYHYEKRLDEGVLYLDTIPSDTTDTIILTYRQPLELITDSTNEFDIEPYLYRALKFNLAVDIWPSLNSTEVSNSLVGLASDAMAKAQTFYPNEVSLFFKPEPD